jgi:hypothetical protein
MHRPNQIGGIVGHCFEKVAPEPSSRSIPRNVAFSRPEDVPRYRRTVPRDAIEPRNTWAQGGFTSSLTQQSRTSYP